MMTVFHSTARSRELAVVDKPRVGSWVHMVAPSDEELAAFAEEHTLDADLLTDAMDIYEAPRVEIDEGNVYLYTRYCYPEGREIGTQPMLIIYTKSMLVTILRNESTILDRLLSGKIEVLTTQKTKLLLRILAEISRSYEIQLGRVSKQTLQIRAQMRHSELSGRDFVSIIEIEEDLNEYVTALLPQEGVLSAIVSGRHIKLYEEDKDIVDDLSLSAVELIEMARSRARALANIRQAYDTIATTDLNQTFKRLTSIAIFFSIPTIIGGLWGMNVVVPLAENKYAFLVVLGIIGSLMATAIYVFHKKRWF